MDKNRETKAKNTRIVRKESKLHRPANVHLDPQITRIIREISPLRLMDITHEELQTLIVNKYRWEKWSEDPWGNLENFYKWLNTVRDDDVLAVWTINDTFGGRVYFAYNIYQNLEKLDYTKMPYEELLYRIGVGVENFLWIKSFSGWEQLQYPEKPLPTQFVNKRVIRAYMRYPFLGYKYILTSVYLWSFAIREVMLMGKQKPEIEGFLSYVRATNSELDKIAKMLAPKNHKFLDKNQAWNKFEQTPEIKRILRSFQKKYKDIFPTASIIKDEQQSQNILEESYVEAQEQLLASVNEKKRDAFKAVLQGLGGSLAFSLLCMTKNDLIDEVRREHRKHKKHELADSQKDIQSRLQNEELDKRFLDTVGGEEIIPFDDTLDLNSLGLNIDKLTPTELRIIKDVQQGLIEGYTFNSKEGKSFQQYWSRDYDKKIKAWNRAKAKLNKK